jgi:D-alanyl-D-alanine carboxypeptidase (penicillin-binding protein 5/6)
MNNLATVIGMKKTKYANTHGLSNLDNKSTALDIAVLCKYALQNETFCRIVSTQSYAGTVINMEGTTKEFVWKNTHRLLPKSEYLGIKTGLTTTAGACLASHIKLGTRDFIMVVLGCKQVDRRFK